jgi:hypothetical protein
MPGYRTWSRSTPSDEVVQPRESMTKQRSGNKRQRYAVDSICKVERILFAEETNNGITRKTHARNICAKIEAVHSLDPAYSVHSDLFLFTHSRTLEMKHGTSSNLSMKEEAHFEMTCLTHLEEMMTRDKPRTSSGSFSSLTDQRLCSQPPTPRAVSVLGPRQLNISWLRTFLKDILVTSC